METSKGEKEKTERGYKKAGVGTSRPAFVEKVVGAVCEVQYAIHGHVIGMGN